MQANANLPPITVSSRDLARLEQLLDSPGLRHVPAALALGEELERATVLAPERMPADVVTMNSTVHCVDELSGEQHHLTLSYPNEADVARHDRTIADLDFQLKQLAPSVRTRTAWEQEHRAELDRIRTLDREISVAERLNRVAVREIGRSRERSLGIEL